MDYKMQASNVNFQGCYHGYLPNKIVKSSNNLLQRMNATTKYSENISNTRFKTEMTPSILINGNISLMNEDKFVVF